VRGNHTRVVLDTKVGASETRVGHCCIVIEDVMDSFFAYLHVLSIAVLVGKVVLLSFVVAPVLARTLDSEHFGTVVRHLFPAYYLVGITTAVIGLIALGAMGVIRGVSQAMVVSVVLWCVVLAGEAYCRSWLTPLSNVMRDRLKQQEVQGSVDPRLKASWNRLHQRSVFLNTVVLIAGLILLGLTHPQSPLEELYERHSNSFYDRSFQRAVHSPGVSVGDR